MSKQAASAPLPANLPVGDPQGAEGPTPETTAQETQDAKDEEAWNEILEKYGRAPEGGEETTEETPQPAEAEQAPPSETPEKEEEAPSGPSDERKAAEQFLRLKAGVPQAALEALPDDEVLRWADDRRGRESEVDAAFARAARAEKETDPKTEKETEGEPSAPTPDLSGTLDGLAEDLALTADGRARLDEFAKALVGPLESKIEALAQGRESDTQAAQMRLVNDVRQQVSERFAGLSDDSTWESVFKDAQLLESSSRYADRSPEDYLPELFADVCKLRGLEEAPDPEAEKKEREAAEADAERRAKLDVDPGPTPGRSPDPKPKTGKAADWERYKEIRAKYRTG